MTGRRFAFAALALLLGVVLPSSRHAYGVPNGSPQYGGYGQGGYGQDRGGWDAPPPELQDVQRRGFHDGIIGAQKDFDNHRQPDPNNRDEYRHPNVPRDQWDAYREGFRRGYERGVAHLTGHDQDQMRDHDRDQGMRDMGPGPAVDVRRRGFQDGMQGAMSDLDNRRPPDPNNRDEYRRPNVPYQLQDPYRDGFRDGYQEAMDILTGRWGSDDHDHDRGPGRDIWIRGLHDGAEGAIRDLQNHRPPDPNNRDEYRHPNVPYQLQDPYRNAFRRGYERVVSELSTYPNRH
jgi:hypothetical protein